MRESFIDELLDLLLHGKVVIPAFSGECRAGDVHQEVVARHCIAGDSNGDYSMLTSFPDDLNVGLILDVPRSGNIQRLKERVAPSRDEVLEGKAPTPVYVIQGRDPSRMEYIKSNSSIR